MEEKYLKYKNKYLSLKNKLNFTQFGGSNKLVDQDRAWKEANKRREDETRRQLGDHLKQVQKLNEKPVIETLLNDYDDMAKGKWNLNNFKRIINALPREELMRRKFYLIDRINASIDRGDDNNNPEIGKQIIDYINSL